ncbi:TetR/AcrR family transcriptional regulator [Melioribacteraceae bacterium 4301-Me]|uniref:TetR/AcrR family transcriptional regulator n=1 Tax=Pyranulibacter aquaticus TaxID=3163344 RepID=UPI00359739B1
MTVKRLDSETRQIQIKKAVLDIISTEGIGKLSTRNLALRIGVTEGALFRHFSSKKAIMLSILEDVKNGLVKEQERITNSKEYKADEKLYNFLCTHVNYLIANKGITILLFSEAVHMNDPQLKKHLREILSIQKEFVSRIIKQGIEEGIWNEEIDTEDAAILYMGIPISLNIELTLNPKFFKKEKFCSSMVSMIKKTLRKK